jgi:sec-independent protein translocase protein TatA
MILTTLNTIYAGMFGWPQMVLIAVVVLLLFGGKKIPQLMKGLGQGMKEFKDASNNPDDKKESTATTETEKS